MPTKSDDARLLIDPQGDVVALTRSAWEHGNRGDRLKAAGVDLPLARQAVEDPLAIYKNQPRPNAHDRKPGKRYVQEIPNPPTDQTHLVVVAAKGLAVAGSGNTNALMAVTIHTSAGMPTEPRIYSRPPKKP